jgi:DNA-binding transcriptional LysR family regulator
MAKGKAVPAGSERNAATPVEEAPRGRGWLNLRMIEMFVAVVQQDGMTNAAARLGTTQSAVSQALTAIESGLGAQLIDRSVRPLQLTRFGIKFYEHAVELLRRARELEQVVEQQRNGRVPLVRIGMVDSFASTIGPHLLRELASSASRWSVVSGVTHTSLRALDERVVDLVVTSEEFVRSPERIVVSLLREPLFIVAPRAMRIAKGPIEALAARLPLIRYSASAFIGRQVEAYLQQQDLALPRQYELDTSDAVLAMVKAGLGWTITTPLCVLKTHPSDRDYRYLPLPTPGPVRRVRLVAQRDQYAELWERVAATSRSIIEKSWLPMMRRFAPWDEAMGCD